MCVGVEGSYILLFGCMSMAFAWTYPKNQHKGSSLRIIYEGDSAANTKAYAGRIGDSWDFPQRWRH